MKVLVQDYLRTHTLAQLDAEFGVTARRHTEFPNLVMLKYNQINSPMAEKLVQQCRGIILDEADDWSIVSRPYDKFFNSGEGHAAPIDWSSAQVYEKLDGSLMVMYFYRGEWRVSSSGLPDASGPVGAGGMTFAELFWRVWRELGYAMPHNHDFCYMFELMTPHNRVVVPHSTERIVLHGARDICYSHNEVHPDKIAMPGWEIVRTFPLGSVEDCLAAADTLRPMECEGYVVCDKHFNRIKVKSPAYVALAHAKEGFNPRAILELVRKNEGEEFLSYFPELRPDYESTKAKFLALLENIRQSYAAIHTIPVQKDFAMEALKTPYSAVMFGMRAGRFATPEAFMQEATIYAVEKMVG